MGKKSEMRKFADAHRGDTFRATDLARELGWLTEREVRYKDDDGEKHLRIEKSHNTTAALRLAKKMGARVNLVVNPDDENRDLRRYYDIVF